MIYTPFAYTSITTRLLIGLMMLLPFCASATNVMVQTPLGNFEIELLDDIAPGTVANFLNYVNDGDYDQSFVHRSVAGFVIQGGGFNFVDGELGNVPVDPPIANEFNLSNLRGTVSMAKLPDNPNSATSQWFVNLADNSEGLDTQNGGFTVFGRVVGDGMAVVDQIATLQLANVPGLFPVLPVIDFTGGAILQENLVFTTIDVIGEPPSGDFEINLGIAGSWFNADTNGQGWTFDVVDNDTTQLLASAWFTYDFNPPAANETDGFGSNQHRWFLANGNFTGNSADMQIFAPAAGVFNDPNFLVSNGDPIGSMTVTFSDCSNGQIAFDFNDPNIADDTVDITRITASTLCQAIVDGQLSTN